MLRRQRQRLPSALMALDEPSSFKAFHMESDPTIDNVVPTSGIS